MASVSKLRLGSLHEGGWRFTLPASCYAYWGSNRVVEGVREVAYEMNGFVEGATFESIVRYVLKNMKITHARAGYLVMEVLKAGIALGRIKRTPRGTYILATDKPGSITHSIREPRFSDDSEDDVSSVGSS